MKPYNILISFCNLPVPSIHPMLCVKIPNDLREPISYTPVALGYSEPTINDVRGLSSSAGKVFALFSRVISSQRAFLVAALDEYDLTPLFCQELPDVKDGHSILATETNLYVVSTGTDEILCYDLFEGGVSNPKVIWQANTYRADTHHINSIVKRDGGLFVSAFGPKTGTLWTTASNGYIHNITRDTRVKEGIYHPHSLSENKERLYYCESSRRSFCSMDGPLFELDGYARGGGWLSDELVCIASSIGRRISRSPGLIANPADPGEQAGASSMIVGNIASRKEVAKIDLSWFGPEIYDILVLETDINLSNLVRLAKLAEKEQMQVMQSQIAEMQTLSPQITTLQSQVAEKDQRIQLLGAQITEILNSRGWRLIQFYRKIISFIINNTFAKDRLKK